MKRVIDIVASLLGLVLLSPILTVIMLLVWRQDGRSPFYLGVRAGRHGRTFDMVKIRSMVANADCTGVESTSTTDNRITPLGHFIRRWKLDELTQLWNVLKGEMSLVGPLPNTTKAVAGYGADERMLLLVRPGITDFSSIVFSDEGEIIGDDPDPDLAYDRLIRPWKSELGLLYVQNSSAWLNVRLIWITLVAVVDKRAALQSLVPLMARLGASDRLLEVSRREVALDRFATVSHG